MTDIMVQIEEQFNEKVKREFAPEPLKEIIFSIEQERDYPVQYKTFSGQMSSDTCDGYLIRTNLQDIFFGISSGQSCCEQWGYICSEEEQEFHTYVGAELLNIKLTDVNRMVAKVDEELQYGFDCGGIMFIDLETNLGVLQFAVYNNHNGYYGHSVYLRSNQLNLDEGL